MSFDSYLLICSEKKSQFLLQDTPKKTAISRGSTNLSSLCSPLIRSMEPFKPNSSYCIDVHINLKLNISSVTDSNSLPVSLLIKSYSTLVFSFRALLLSSVVAALTKDPRFPEIPVQWSGDCPLIFFN